MNEHKFRVWDSIDKCMDNDISILDLVIGNYPSDLVDDRYTPECLKSGLVWMHYIGLKDKNEVEICEGDILSQHNVGKNNLSIVEWNDGGFVFLYKTCQLTRLAIEQRELRVIGNIYENPELINEPNFDGESQ